MTFPLRILLTAGSLFLPLSIVSAQPDSPESAEANTDASVPARSPAPELPETEDSPEKTAEPKPAAPQPIIPTVIEADHAEMVTGDTGTRFVFTGNIVVTGNNLVVRCDRMEVFSTREEQPAATSGPPEIGRMEKIIATGNVHIEQEGREGRAGRAEIFLIEGRIVLTESPVIRNEQGNVSGFRITFIQGEAQAIVESGEGQRARIVLPTLPDLGTETEKR